MIFYQVHGGDEAKATGHLTPLQYGIWARLRAKSMETERPLPAHLVERWAGVRTAADRAALKVVLVEFFVIGPDGAYECAEFSAQIARYRDKRDKAKRSADARWSQSEGSGKAMRTHSERIAKAMRTHSEGNANHKPRTNNQEEHTPQAEDEQPGVCVLSAIKAMREAGIKDAPDDDQRVRELVRKGVGPEQFAAAARIAVKAGKGFEYALGVIRNQLTAAAGIADLPSQPPQPWDLTRSSIEARGDALGMGRWDEAAFNRGGGEPFPVYERRVRRAHEERQTTSSIEVPA